MAPSQSRLQREQAAVGTPGAEVNASSFRRFLQWIKRFFGDMGTALKYAWLHIPECFCGGCKMKPPEGVTDLVHWLPAGFIILLFALLWAMFDIGYLANAHVSFWSAQSIVSHVCIGMSLWSYFRVVFTDPGSIPQNIGLTGQGIDQLSTKKGGAPRYFHNHFKVIQDCERSCLHCCN